MTNRIKEVFAIVFAMELEELTDDITQDEIENWDSLNHMNLIVALEEEFEVNFTDEEILEIMSLPLIIEILKEKGIK